MIQKKYNFSPVFEKDTRLKKIVWHITLISTHWMSRLKHSRENFLLLMLMILSTTKAHNSEAGSCTPLVHDFCITTKDISIKTQFQACNQPKRNIKWMLKNNITGIYIVKHKFLDPHDINDVINDTNVAWKLAIFICRSGPYLYI